MVSATGEIMNILLLFAPTDPLRATLSLFETAFVALASFSTFPVRAPPGDVPSLHNLGSTSVVQRLHAAYAL